jgi:hypothetical protein
MKNLKEIVVVCSVCLGVSVVAASIDIMTSKNNTTFNLKPGFNRRSITIYPTSYERISKYCFRSNDSDGTTEYFPPGSDLFRHKEQHVLILEEDFDAPITITVESERSRQSGNPPDPAIVIRSLNGAMLICDDYYSDHGNIEVLNTDDLYNHSSQLDTGTSNLPGFEPKAGTYLMEIWSYYQPAEAYRIIITEDEIQ